MSKNSGTTVNDQRTVKILVVDDDPHDHFLFNMAAQESDRSVDVDFASDGASAIKSLQRSVKAGSMPDVVILDIKMPDMDGHEVLSVIRKDPAMADVDAIMFSNSHRQSEIRRSIAEGALWHEVKPSVYMDLVAFVDQVAARILDR